VTSFRGSRNEKKTCTSSKEKVKAVARPKKPERHAKKAAEGVGKGGGNHVGGVGRKYCDLDVKMEKKSLFGSDSMRKRGK